MLLRPNEQTRAYLEDVGVNLTRRDGQPIKRSELFTYPDLQRTGVASNDVGPKIRSDEVENLIGNERRLLIYGDDESGKTTLAKTIYAVRLKQGKYPLLMRASQNVTTNQNLRRLLTKTIQDQYGREKVEHYEQISPSERVVIIDDFHNFAKTLRIENFLEYLEQYADHVVLLADQQIQDIVDLLNPPGALNLITHYKSYRILPFGKYLRNEIIGKWLLLNVSESDNADSISRKRELISRRLNSLVGRILIPPHPVYLLAVLQASDDLSRPDSDIGTYGSYYEIFTQNSLARGRATQNFDFARNYLSTFAQTLFDSNNSAMDVEKVRLFHRKYEVEHGIGIDFLSTLEDFINCQMLERLNGSVSFKYKYVYFYFAATWLEQNIDSPKVRSIISDLSRSLHIDGNSNLLLFLTHISKNPVILESILDSAKNFYPNMEVATLEEPDAWILNGARMTLSTTFTPSDVEENLRKRLKAEDELDENPILPIVEYPTAGNLEPVDIENPLDSFRAAMKTVQIIGEIVRKFPSLMADEKIELMGEGYRLTFRTLRFIRSELWEVHDLVFPQIVEQVRL